MKKLYMVFNEDRFFLSHRKDIAVRAKEVGFDVSIVCKDTGRRSEVEALGLNFIELSINPTGKNPLEEIKTFLFLWKLYRYGKPDVVHHIGLKCVLWGTIAARLANVKGVVNAISGLGVLFSQEKRSAYAQIVMGMMNLWNNKNRDIAIFQNVEDMNLFVDHGIVEKAQVVFIKGSGVNLEEYNYTSEATTGKIIVLFTARMVKEKGVTYLIEAAESLRQDYEDKVEFWLCGGLSNNPKALQREQLEAACDGRYIKWLGYRSDVATLLQKANIVAFPSFYREGVPRSLIEACAVGRPIVTCDSVGCKDVVDDGVNGFLVPIKDSDMLAEKLRLLINDRELRISMGLKGREKAEKEFNIKDIVDKHIKIYNTLLHEL